MPVINRLTNTKEQSQFAAARVGANSLDKGDYGDNMTGRAEENKANLAFKSW